MKVLEAKIARVLSEESRRGENCIERKQWNIQQDPSGIFIWTLNWAISMRKLSEAGERTAVKEERE